MCACLSSFLIQMKIISILVEVVAGDTEAGTGEMTAEPGGIKGQKSASQGPLPEGRWQTRSMARSTFPGARHHFSFFQRCALLSVIYELTILAVN